MGNVADATVRARWTCRNSAATSAAQKMEWRARRTRVKIGTEAVPVYRMETSVLGHHVLVDISTLGEILRVELPGDISARIDEWGKP